MKIYSVRDFNIYFSSPLCHSHRSDSMTRLFCCPFVHKIVVLTAQRVTHFFFSRTCDEDDATVIVSWSSPQCPLFGRNTRRTRDHVKISGSRDWLATAHQTMRAPHCQHCLARDYHMFAHVYTALYVIPEIISYVWFYQCRLRILPQRILSQNSFIFLSRNFRHRSAGVWTGKKIIYDYSPFLLM